MPPVIFRGRGRGRRGRGEIVTHHDQEAGPSGTRHPSMTRSEEPQRRRDLYEPARHSTSHSSTPSYRHSFGPDSENNPNNPQPSFIPLQRSVSHRNYDDPTPYYVAQFNPADYIQEPSGFVPLGPQDHFSEDPMEEDEDPTEPARGTPTHPIEVSDGSSYHGPQYQGPDSFMPCLTDMSGTTHHLIRHRNRDIHRIPLRIHALRQLRHHLRHRHNQLYLIRRGVGGQMLVCLHEEEGVSTSALLDILVVATIRRYKKKDLQVLYKKRTPHQLHEIRHHLGMTNPYLLIRVRRLTTRSNRHKHNTTTAMSATHMWCRQI
ncbi:hypothetical protein HanPSC8_Chr08g0331511 [Helianthus annuus]|nr:hypothetical protein HanPSC8_Chr08g0331511 [Helianthus annuus]